MVGVTVDAPGGELACAVLWWNTQRLCERQQQLQGWRLSKEWCGPWNLLAGVVWPPRVEPEGGGAHQSQGAWTIIRGSDLGSVGQVLRLFINSRAPG